MPSLDRLHKPVLVLNASYEPINICAARRAVVLILKGVASAEELAPSHLHSARRDPVTGVSPDSASDAGALAQEHPDARPLHLPVLPQDAALRRDDARPRDTAFPIRRNDLGEPRCLLPPLQ
jgi:hypothetical protein